MKMKKFMLLVALALSMAMPVSAYAQESEAPVIESSASSLFGCQINFKNREFIDKIQTVQVNEEAYTKTESRSGLMTEKKYWISDTDPAVGLSTLKKGDVVQFITDAGTLTFTIKDPNGLISIIDKETIRYQAKEETKPSVQPEEPQKDEPETPITLTPGMQNSFFVVEVSPKEWIQKLKSVKVNHREYAKADSKWQAWVEGKYFPEETVLHMKELKENDVLTLEDQNGQTQSFRYHLEGSVKQLIPVKEETVPKQKALKVRLVGKFESAMVNQKGYDAISGATTAAVQNKNSNVVVQVTEADTPQETDWVDLNKMKQLEITQASKVVLDAASGMKGIYSTYDSSVTLNGTPKTPGTYKVKVQIVDKTGRTATSNELPFVVYDYNETLKDRMTIQNAQKTQDGKYLWDVEPWVIQKFGGKNEEVSVPSEIKAIYGSHASGTYGELGVSVEGEPSQKLIVDKGTDVTLVNMKLLSSVEVVVKGGGKLSLHDSSVHGKITVEKGGEFQMNYDSFGKKFLTGASINGQLELKDGAVLKDSLIYSNTNFLPNGKKARRNVEPVVKISGNVQVKGNVFVRGDESPTGDDPKTGKPYTGQPALAVENGTLTITENSTLGVYGGGSIATTTLGGSALVLDNGTVDGEGKLIAVGGSGSGGDGGEAVSGTGRLQVKQAYLQGGDTYRKDAKPGQPATQGIAISKTIGSAAAGKNLKVLSDGDQPTYWRGTAVPDFEKIVFGTESLANVSVTEEPKPSEEPKPGVEPKPSEEPKPGVEPKPSEEPKPGVQPKPSEESKPGVQPKPSEEPKTGASTQATASGKTETKQKNSLHAKGNGPTNGNVAASQEVKAGQTKAEGTKSPKTGDPASIYRWMLLLLVSALGVLGIDLRRRKKRP